MKRKTAAKRKVHVSSAIQFPLIKIKDGEWVLPIQERYRFTCCDCGLTHRMDFRVSEEQVQFRVFRDNDSTAEIRSHDRIVGPFKF